MSGGQSEFDREKEKLKLEDDTRKTLAQIIGGAVFLFGLIFTYNTYRLNVEQIKLSTKQQEISQEGQITDRFTKAVSQLGNENIEVRLGGLYALERIAKDSPKDHWSVIEILSAYIREKSPNKTLADVIETKDGDLRNKSIEKKEFKKEVIKTDIQVALSIIGRRKAEQDPQDRQIDLTNAHLKGADLRGANLQGANLSNANLFGADLSNANLSAANFIGANLCITLVIRTDLSNAIFYKADFRGARFNHANLVDASLIYEQLETVIIDEDTKLPQYLEPRRKELLEISLNNQDKIFD